MSTSEALRSTSNSVSNSFNFEATSDGHSPVWSISWEAGEISSQASEVTSGPLPQYSWRRHTTPANSSEAQCICPPLSSSPPKVELNPKYLIRKKNEILLNIALEYSHLAGLMNDELNAIGTKPEGYAEVMRAYSKAVDDYECFQMYVDSLVLKIIQEAEDNVEPEKQVPNKGTCYILSPRILRRLNFGSLQNIVRAQEQECKYSIGVTDLTTETNIHSHSRASSAPRDGCSLGIPRSATISATSVTDRYYRSFTKETPKKTLTPSPAPLRPTLRRFFSLKSLSDSLSTLNTRTVTAVERRFTEGADGSGDGSGGEQLPPPAHSRRALCQAQPSKVNDLIAWKNVEIATVQNILRVNMARAVDTTLNKKSRRAYRDCAQENQKTLVRLYRESERLKATRQSVLASRSQSVGRFESPTTPPPLPLSQCLASQPLSFTFDKYDVDYQHHHHPHQLSYSGDVISDSSSLHADEQSSDSSRSSTKQVHRSDLAISCHSSGPIQHFDSVPPFRKEVLSPPPSTKSLSNDLQNSFTERAFQSRTNGCGFPRAPLNYVQYLFPNQTNQITMRHYGRPNYSRHGNASFAQSVKWDFSEFPKHCSNQDCHVNLLYQTLSSHRYPVQYTNATSSNHVWPSFNNSSPMHFNKSLRGGKLVSELERLTSPLGGQFTSPEVALTTNSRPRFTLADKLNMCTASFH